MHRFLSEMAKSVKESGSNSGRQRLLLETEKSAFFHKSNVIAGINNQDFEAMIAGV